MSETKWTKGPWAMFDTQYQSSVEEWPHYSIGGTEFETHAVVRPGCEEALEKGDMLANARLIAAAPELYEAAIPVRNELADVVSEFLEGHALRSPDGTPDVMSLSEDDAKELLRLRRILAALDYALAKARGETP